MNAKELKVYKICSNCNVEYKLTLRHGAGVDANVTTFEDCPHCGLRDDSWLRIPALLEDCPECGGSGKVPDHVHSVNAGIDITKPCPACQPKSLSKIMQEKRENFGCEYPDSHPPYCNCKSCKKYSKWLKEEYPKLRQSNIVPTFVKTVDGKKPTDEQLEKIWAEFRPKSGELPCPDPEGCKHFINEQKQAARIEQLEEWKQAVLGKIKRWPIYEKGKWAGDKEGWGYVFELIGAAQNRIEQLEAENKWIPVSEKLPEVRQWVLGYWPDDVHEPFSVMQWWKHTKREYDEISFTHWKPIILPISNLSEEQR